MAIRILKRACLMIACLTMCSITALPQSKGSTDQKIKEIEARVKKLSDRITLLEAIISPTATRQNSTIQALHYGYIVANRDGVINDLNNLASSAFQFRIRPTSMGGGGGTYLGYTIPKKLANNDNGAYSASVFGDSVIFVGTANKISGTVTATISVIGRLHDFIFSGEFE